MLNIQEKNVPEECATGFANLAYSHDSMISSNNPEKSISPFNPPPINYGKRTPAVEVRNATKIYRSRKGTSTVLDGLNMTVQEGSIYSLLGSSGCGKTTLLSCCVGLRDLNSGDVRIFGAKPGTRKAGVPGYMPQELALYPELTIHEHLLYYGRMFGMTKRSVIESAEFLINFLALPPPHRRVGTLSGGQQRRVSFAVALVNSPRLLILDEPTVGVDPLLRQSIWDHLVKLVSTGQTSVIITTHYIEEARQSHKIGLMRHGRLLVEDSPSNLLSLYNTNLLENIVLKLCIEDRKGDVEGSSASPASSIEDVTLSKADDANKNYYLPETLHPEDVSTVELKRVVMGGGAAAATTPSERDERRSSSDFTLTKGTSSSSPLDDGIEQFQKISMKLRRHNSLPQSRPDTLLNRSKESYSRIRAIVLKNVVILFRNYLFLLFMLVMPAMQIVTMCVTVGQDPKGIEFGLVNLDVEDPSNCSVVPGCVGSDNYTGRLSCAFLSMLEEKGTLHLNYFDKEEDAIEQVRQTQIWGYLMFGSNYTETMIERATFGIHADPSSLYGSRIKFRLDQSNLQISRESTKVFLETFTNFLESISKECQLDPVLTQPPIYFAQPVFGQSTHTFTEFLAPNILIGILFFFPMTGSGISYILEKKMGTLSRSLVAGVTAFEMMTAYLVIQAGILCIQCTFSLLILQWVFNIVILGPSHCAFLLSVITGITGMSAGFLIAVILEDEMMAVLVCIGTFLPNIMISGLLWPLEGLPTYLLLFSKVLPCTFAGEALRSVISRGVSYTHPSVYPGFAILAVWIVVFWGSNLLCQRFRSKG